MYSLSKNGCTETRSCDAAASIEIASPIVDEEKKERLRTTGQRRLEPKMATDYVAMKLVARCERSGAMRVIPREDDELYRR